MEAQRHGPDRTPGPPADGGPGEELRFGSQARQRQRFAAAGAGSHEEFVHDAAQFNVATILVNESFIVWSFKRFPATVAQQ